MTVPFYRIASLYSTYFTEQMPTIIREVNAMYDVDGFFTNGWPSTGRPPRCHCEACQGGADPNTHCKAFLLGFKRYRESR
jgi:hypothetical protein